jgi:excisionase family DNA binding protein
MSTRGVSAPVTHPDFDIDAIARRATISVDEAAALLGIGRSAAYEAARRGQLPTRRLGRRLFVPVPALLEWLGLSAAPDRG